MSWEKPLFYATNRVGGFQKAHWDALYPTLGAGGKFWLDLSVFFDLNWFVPRQGSWATPWPAQLVPGFEMPAYDPGFSASFEEVTDRRALDVKQLIAKTGAPVALYYSGGIDSTVCLAALIRNLSSEELKRVHVCLNADSVIENPVFYQKFIRDKLTVIDSAITRYSNLIDRGYYAITADQGDCLFGTEAALQLYFAGSNLLARLAPGRQREVAKALTDGSIAEKPFRDFADLIQLHFHVDRNPEFGRIFYERVLRNIETSNVPIHSVHDFFWWVIFNLKYMHCALRCVISYYGGTDYAGALQTNILNWFNHADYQRWSMANNNNGEKIRGSSATTYKWAARKYIHTVDGNDWYFRHKLKLMSLGNILKRNSARLDNFTVFGLDGDYRLLRITDPGVLAEADSSLRSFNLDGPA